ncbi:MAG: tRNA 2-selenouridine(34) synthase MnmH [Chitinophagaceae bacterium]
MAIEKIHINRFLELSKNIPVLDVRSPSEFEHASIPGAHNLPLLTDEERKIVGTAYKQQSREAAIKLGLDFFGPKMRKMVEEVESIVRSHKPGARSESEIKNKSGANLELPTYDSRPVLLHCWRGGMRSAGVAWLLDLYGFKVYTLIGGYKNYRKWIVETFSLPYSFTILGGYTGSGKTYVLDELEKNGQAVINLEKLANHKGSAFGNIGMPKQPTQEMFENLLATELRTVSPQAKEVSIQYQPSIESGNTKSSNLANRTEVTINYKLQTTNHIWLEDESQRIGRVNIPHNLWNTMRQSPILFLAIPFEERLKHIVQEYGLLDKEQMLEAITRIEKRLGGLETKSAQQHLKDGDISSCFRILLRYYDKWYSKGLNNRDQLTSLLTNFACETVEAGIIATRIIEKNFRYHEK